MHPLIQSLHGGLIVSCQAPLGSPLHEPEVIAALGAAAVLRGAVGLRIDTPAHIQAVVRRRVPVPIIGLWKQASPKSEVYITPQFAQAAALGAAGAQIIALDGTSRPRPGGESLAEIIAQIHGQIGALVMADVDTVDSALASVAAGADLVGTTLYGYTPATQDCQPPGFDLLSTLSRTLPVPVLCEGGVSSPAMACRALELGAHAVVVGTAITGVDAQVQAYCRAMVGES